MRISPALDLDITALDEHECVLQPFVRHPGALEYGLPLSVLSPSAEATLTAGDVEKNPRTNDTGDHRTTGHAHPDRYRPDPFGSRKPATPRDMSRAKRCQRLGVIRPRLGDTPLTTM